jgi:hypothetical protein
MTQKTAQFRIYDGIKLIKEYKVDYVVAPGERTLNQLFQEAREVWAEYCVEVETDAFIMSRSHTYAEEVKQRVTEW